MLKRIFPVLLILAVFLTACGAQGTPTMAPGEVEGTAVAAAWTMVAMTQQAIPTATPLPPTDVPSPTPLPTFTPEALLVFPTPTYAFPPTATQGPSDPNNCAHPLDLAEAGPTKRVRIENQTGGTLNLSLNLWKPNDFGQCGALSWGGVGKNATFIVNLPNGAWYAYAWVTLKNGTQHTAEGSFFFGNSKSQDLNRLVIHPDVIGLIGP